jgi:hypothetical protein
MPGHKISKHINMSLQSEPICLRVLERLETVIGKDISRVEEVTYFDDYRYFFEAAKSLNLHISYNHMADLDDTPEWDMSGDSTTQGYLCVAFEHPDGSVTLLREVCERNKSGEPYVSQAWLPEYNFTKDSPVSLDEQKRFLQMRFYDTSPKKPLIFKYVPLDEEEDESFIPKSEEAKEAEKKAENAKAIELLISSGMMIKNAQGEYEFKNIPYKPTRIGVITADS